MPIGLLGSVVKGLGSGVGTAPGISSASAMGGNVSPVTGTVNIGAPRERSSNGLLWVAAIVLVGVAAFILGRR